LIFHIDKIYKFLPNGQILSCPSSGSYYLYKDGKDLKVGCTHHRTINSPRIGF
jgi:hypothetical protein